MASSFASWPNELRREHGRLLGAVWNGVGQVADRAGAWRRLRALDFTRVDRLVFVCRGNVCRSAYAEARAESLGLRADSFGLAARSGAPAPPRAIEVARARSVDLSRHLARTRSEVALNAGDLLLAMEPAQVRVLRAVAAAAGVQVSLLGLWARAPRFHLQDPLDLGRAYFETCFSLIDSAIDALAAELRGAR